MKSNNEIIDTLEQIRINQGLSISELARRVGMAKSALSRYFNKTREFPVNRVDTFAKALHTTPEYILGFEEGSKTSQEIKNKTNQLTIEAQKKVLEFVEFQISLQNKNS